MGMEKAEKKQWATEMDAVSETLSSLYTGVFFIDLEQDAYSIVKGVHSIEKMLRGIHSAQLAINTAIKQTVYDDEMLDMFAFVDLSTLPERMGQEKIVTTDYMGVISGWVRGSFMAVKRGKEQKVTQVLYTYQIVDEEKRKELEHLEELKRNYARSEEENRENREKAANLEADKLLLTDDLQYNSNFTKIVMEQMNCGILVYTLPGRSILEINPAALKIFGWKDKEEAVKNLMRQYEKIRLVDSKKKQQLLKIRETEGSVKYRFTISQEAGGEKLILGESKSLTGRHGGRVIMTTMTDITNIRDLEADNSILTDANTELQLAREAVQTILRSGSYICRYAEDGEQLVNIKFSDALRKLYGYSGSADAPDTWATWLRGAHPDDREYVEKSYYAALKDRTGNTNYDVTFRALKKDGSVRWYRAAAHIIRRPDGTAEFCYGFIMDVDEQKKAENQVKAALRQAEIANEAKTTFLTRMSHDIRTPMNGILGLIEINERHAEDIEFTSRNREKAKVAANHLLSLINDVLQLSKLENSVVELSDEPFDLKALSDEILIIIEQRAKERCITVERKDDADAFRHPYVYGSPLHVKQIFINILGNSIKYNKECGKIFCSAEMENRGENELLFKVDIRDTGIGMSEDFLKHLFEPFAREKDAIEDGREGTGLGMAIVKQLLDRMGGTIHVSSIPDVGSSFHVEIPFKTAPKEVLESEKEDTGKDIHGKHILLVEDNELNMEIAEIILTDAGAIVSKAVNGREAVDTFKKNPPDTFDMILMDVLMPIMNGYDATKTIRKLDREDAKKIPIIAITANAFTEDVENALKAGMNDHLAKPLNIKKMIAMIAKYVKD